MAISKLINLKELDQLSYYIFSSKSPGAPRYKDIYNSAFEMWFSVWENEFKKLSFPTDSLVDDFIRQDVIVALAKGNDIAAVHLYSFLSLKSLASMKHRYMADNYNDEFNEKMSQRGINNVMTWEYLTVSPDWRKSKVGISLGKVILNLASKVLQVSNAECAIAPARNDYRVSEMVYDVGGEPIVKSIVNHNVECDLVSCFKDKACDSSDNMVAMYANKYWDQRVDAQSKIWQEAKEEIVRSPIVKVA